MSYPAFLKSFIVLSCRLPFGIPSFSLFSISIPPFFEKTTFHACMAGNAFLLDFQQQCIIIAVIFHFNNFLHISACCPLLPELIPAPAPVSCKTASHCLEKCLP